MAAGSVWEYAERFYEFKGHPLVEGSFITREQWATWEARAFELMRADLNAGWEVDQSVWGSYRIKHKNRRVNMLSRSLAAWVVYIIIGMVTFGIGFLVAPFLMYGNFMQFEGIEVRLMRRKS
jgi:hypothetical protein